jgi:hypothetical protein
LRRRNPIAKASKANDRASGDLLRPTDQKPSDDLTRVRGFLLFVIVNHLSDIPEMRVNEEIYAPPSMLQTSQSIGIRQKHTGSFIGVVPRQIIRSLTLGYCAEFPYSLQFRTLPRKHSRRQNLRLNSLF